MSKTVNTKILLRNDTYSNWQTNNPTLAKGEIGVAIITQNGVTTKNFKIGDGVTPWNDLSWDGRLQEEILEGILRTQKRSGSIVTFDDGADAPLKECICQINPVQDLHGQDVPYPAGGSANLLDPSVYETTSSVKVDAVTNGLKLTALTDGQYKSTYKVIPFTGHDGSTLYLKSSIVNSGSNNGSVSVRFFDGNGEISGSTRLENYATRQSHQVTVPTGTTRLNIVLYVTSSYSGSVNDTATITNMMLSLTDTAYKPYSNICPISGWDGVTVIRSGKNLLPNTATSIESRGVAFTAKDDGSVIANGTPTGGIGSVYIVRNIKIKPGTYIMSGCPSGGGLATYSIRVNADSDATALQENDYGNGATFTTVTGTIDNVYIIIREGYTANNLVFKPMFRPVSVSDATYEPYTADSHSLSFPSTVYSGYVDIVSKKLVVNYASVDLGSFTWSKYIEAQNPTYHARITGMATNRAKAICSNYGLLKSWVDVRSIPDKMAETHPSLNAIYIRDDAYETASDFKAAMSGVQLVYELAEPVEYDIDISIIKSRQGFNTIWTNADNLELEYYKQNFQESVNDVNHFDIYINPQDDENLVVAADMTNPNSSIWINPNGSNFVMPNVNVSKSDNVTTVTTTNNIGVTNSVEIVDGVDGITPHLTIGEVEALPFDDDATVEITGTQENPVLNFGIPKILQDEETEMAAIATFDDGAYDMPLKSCICQVNAVQDLHGQDAPYPAGGGKNLLDESLMSNVDANMRTITLTLEPNTQYTASSTLPLYGGSTANFFFHLAGESEGTNTNGVSASQSRTLTTGADGVAVVAYRRGSYTAEQFLDYKYQVEKGSTATAYAPYSNICPITGWDGVTVIRSGKNLINLANVTAGVYEAVFLPEGTYYIYQFTGNASHNSMFQYSLTGTNYINIPTVDDGYAVAQRSSVSYNRLTNCFTLHQACWFRFGIMTNANVSENPIDVMLTTDGTNYENVPYNVSTLAYKDSMYEPYSANSYPLTFPSTVYGGWVDVVSGNGVSNVVFVDSSKWVKYAEGNGYSAYKNNNNPSGIDRAFVGSKPRSNIVSVFGSFSSSNMTQNIIQIPRPGETAIYMALQDDIDPSTVELCYITDATTDFTVDPVTIKTLLGNNNVYCDTGGIRNVIYPVSSTLYDNITAAIRIGEEIEDQLQEIQEQINSVGSKIVTVNGTDVSITGEDNTIYVCGEVSTISITPPQIGIINVLFTSGTSKAILTLPNTVKMPEWFVVEEDQTYEISILNGVYGTVMSWAN